MANGERILVWALGFIGTSVVGLSASLIKHLSSSKKHPCTDDIVFEKNCDDRRDCIETTVKDLKDYSKERFDRIEKLILDGKG